MTPRSTILPRGSDSTDELPIVAGKKFRPKTVLLVDDDASVLALLGETIAGFGHRVIQAKDGPEALRCLLKHRSIDCIFSDVVMPNGMTGVQLMAAVQAVRPGMPAVLASSYSHEYVSTLGEIPENVGFITKPYLLIDLFALLDRHADKLPSQAAAQDVGSHLSQRENLDDGGARQAG